MKAGAAKRTDTERLDWLLRTCAEDRCDLTQSVDGESQSVDGEWFFKSDTSDAGYKTGRDAIDGEMDYEAREAKKKRPNPRSPTPGPARRRRP
jgi:hypothetical protein